MRNNPSNAPAARRISARQALLSGLLLFFLLMSSFVHAENYEYDDIGRLTTVTHDDGSTINYRYDKAGNIVEISKTVLALPPDGKIDTPEENVTIKAGESVNFTASASDPDNNVPLAVRWDFDGAAEDANEEDPGDVVFAAAGTYNVEFHVTDATGLSDPTPARRTITVEAAASPPPSSGPPQPVAVNQSSGGGSSDFLLLGALILALAWRRCRNRVPAALLVAGVLASPPFAHAADWSTMESGTVTNLRDVWGAASDNVYAVGDNGLILHFDGDAWTPMNSGTAEGLHAIYGTGPNDIYAVGGAATILHFDGTSWSPIAGPPDEANAFVDLWTAGPGARVWFITGRRAYYYESGTWTPKSFSNNFTATLTPDAHLQAISGYGDTVLVVARPTSASGSPFYVDFRDTDPIGQFVTIHGAFGINSNDMYIVGEVSYRFSGGNPRTRSDWKRVTPMARPVDVWGSAPDNVFAVGTNFNNTRGAIAHYDGNPENTWTTSLDTAEFFLSAVWGFADGTVYAVGEQGRIYRYAEGEPVLTADNFPHSGWLTGNINAHTGELVIDETDFDLGGNIPISFTRYYASGLDSTRPLKAEMGRNWSHNYDWRIYANGDTARVLTPRGRRIVFTNDGTEWILESDHDVSYQLRLDPSDGPLPGWVLLDPEKERFYRFRQFDGRLTQIRNRNGNFVNILYVANFDPPVSVTDNRGRVLNLQYDANINLVQVTAASSTNRRVMKFGYQDGNLVTATDAMNRVTHYAYDASGSPGRITSVMLPRGNTPISWRYSDDGRVSEESYADGTSSAVFYASGTTPPQVVMPDDSVKSLTHDEQGRLVSVLDAGGFRQQIGYADEGISKLTDRLGFATTLAYSPDHGELLSVTHSVGGPTTYGYTKNTVYGFDFHDVTSIRFPDDSTKTIERSPNGHVDAIVDIANNRWEFDRDAAGNLLRTTVPGGATMEFGYAGNDLLTSITDSAGNVTRLGYDAEMRLRAVVHPGPEGLNRTYEYDDNSRLTSIVNEAGQRTTVGYDENGNITSIDVPGMAPILQGFDDLDRLVTTTSPKGGIHKVGYDRLNRTVTFTNPLQHESVLTLDRLNRPASFVQGVRMPWGIGFDAEGVMERIAMPDQRQVELDRTGDPRGLTTDFRMNGVEAKLEIDDEGQVVGYVDSRNRSTSQEFDDPLGFVSKQLLQDPFISSRFEYDDFGNVMLIEDPNGHQWRRSYDNSNRLATVTDPLGRATKFDYTERNRVRAVEFPGGMGRVDIDYHPLGFESERRYSDGTVLNYDYDALGRLAGGNDLYLGYDENGNIDDSNGVLMTYDDADRLETVEFAPGRKVTYVYDDRNMLIGVRDWTGDAISFRHDDTGRVTDISRANGVATALGYDVLGHLSDIQVPGISSISLMRRSDGLVETAKRNVPRPTGLTSIGKTTFDHDEASQVRAYGYDSLGRRLNDGRYDYDWALSSRLNGYAGIRGQAAFTYDAVGMRTSRTDANGKKDYVWNYALGLPSVSIQRQGDADQRYFVHTPGGDLLYSIEPDGSRRFYHFDENGNTLYLTDGGGQVIASYAYSPYGEILLEVDPVDNPFKFLGQRGVMQEGDDGLYYMRARYYDAASGRFLSRDPIQGKTPRRINPYQYAQGNPLVFRDPTGLKEEEGDESWLGWVFDRAVEKASDIVNGGFGVMNVIGANWSHIREVTANGFKPLVEKTERATRRAVGRGRATIHHVLANEALKTRARTPAPATPLGDIAASTKWAIFGGIVTAIIENSQEYVDTTAGHVMAKAGVGGVNTAASFNPYSALFVGASSILDAGTEYFFDVRLGAHEILNTPFRLGSAVVEDIVVHGRNPLSSRSSVTRATRDLRNNRGGLSYALAVPGEWLVENTIIGDIAAYQIQTMEDGATFFKNGAIAIKDSIGEYLFGADDSD